MTASKPLQQPFYYAPNGTNLPNAQPAVQPVVPYPHYPAVVVQQMAPEPKSSSTGFVLFLVGFCFPICWMIGACCVSTRTGSDRTWRTLNAIMTTLTVLGIIVVAVLYFTVFSTAAAIAMMNPNATTPASFAPNNTVPVIPITNTSSFN